MGEERPEEPVEFVELMVMPVDDGVRDDLSEAPGWRAYADEMARVLLLGVELCRVDAFELGLLVVGEPVVDRPPWLREGGAVPVGVGVAVLLNGLGGGSPCCNLVARGRMRVLTGWDGVVSLVVPDDLADAVAAGAGLRSVVAAFVDPFDAVPPDEERVAAFRPVPEPGELHGRVVHGRAELDAARADGFALVLDLDREPDLRATVPDADGVVRDEWSLP